MIPKYTYLDKRLPRQYPTLARFIPILFPRKRRGIIAEKSLSQKWKRTADDQSKMKRNYPILKVPTLWATETTYFRSVVSGGLE